MPYLVCPKGLIRELSETPPPFLTPPEVRPSPFAHHQSICSPCASLQPSFYLLSHSLNSASGLLWASELPTPPLLTAPHQHPPAPTAPQFHPGQESRSPGFFFEQGIVPVPYRPPSETVFILTTTALIILHNACSQLANLFKRHL